MFCRYSELTIFMNNEQSVVILWVSWCKNKSFWQRFTCTAKFYHLIIQGSMYYYLYKWHSILISYLVVKITKLVITHVAFLIFHTNIWVTSCQCKRYLILIAPLFDLINYRAGGIFPFIPQILSKTCSLNLHFITAPPNIFRPSTVSAVFKRHRTLWRKACFSKILQLAETFFCKKHRTFYINRLGT